MGEVLDHVTRTFLRECVGSVEELVVLCALREHRDRAWTAEQLGDKLHIPPALADGAARALCTTGLAAITRSGIDDLFRYSPGSKEVEDAVDGVALAYAEHPIAVMNALSEDALERVRMAAAQRLWSAVEIAKKQR